MEIKELEEVELKRDLPKFGLRKGQKGIVVIVHNCREIEFGCKREERNLLVTVPINTVR